MAMLTLNGVVQNVYTQPESKDWETGEIRPASLRAQILCENTTQDGKSASKWSPSRDGRFSQAGWAKGSRAGRRLCCERRYHVLCAEERSATHFGLENAQRLRQESWAWPVSTALMTNTTDMESLAQPRAQRSPRIRNSQETTGAHGAAAWRGPAVRGASGRGRGAPLVLMRNYEPRGMALRVERFALQSVAREILPKTRTALCLRARSRGRRGQRLEIRPPRHGPL